MCKYFIFILFLPLGYILFSFLYAILPAFNAMMVQKSRTGWTHLHFVLHHQTNKDLRNSERLLDLKNTNLENLWLWTSFVTHGKKHLNDNLKMSLEPVYSCAQKCDCGVPFLFTVPWPPVQKDKRAETMTKRLRWPVNTVEITFQEMT